MSEIPMEKAVTRDASLVEISLNDLEQIINVNQNVILELESRLQSVLRPKEPQPMADDSKVSMEVIHSRISENVKNQVTRIEWCNEKLRFIIDHLEI